MVEDDFESLPGVGPATADKLVKSGYDSYQSVAIASPGELSNRADIGSSTASDIINAVRDATGVGGLETGSMVFERCQQVGKLSWQVDEVDEFLGGGLETQSITGVYGELDTGKSQIAHQLVVNVQLPPEQGGLSGGYIFIDSEGAFRPEHIDDVVRGLEDEALGAMLGDHEMEGSINDKGTIEALIDDFFDKVHVAGASSSNHQILLAEKAKKLADEHEDTEWSVRLLCTDPPTVHFRTEHIGRDEFAECQQKLNKHSHDLMRIGDLFNTGILVTSQVSSNPDPYSGDPTQPIGGSILSHTLTFRIYLRKSKGDKCIVCLVDAPNLTDGEAIMRAQDTGLKPG